MKLTFRKEVVIVCLSSLVLLGVDQASAFTSMGLQIESYCDSNGYPLLAEYATDTCDAACHRNPQGSDAFASGDFAYFCPQPVVIGPVCTDADADGFYVEGLECGTPADFDDTDASAYPGAGEDCSDQIDNDGNGLIDAADPSAIGCPLLCMDMDNDGYNLDGGACGPIDCDDNDASINPGAEENCSDTIDNNCNGLTDTADMNAVGCPLTCTDIDGDGYSIEGNECGAIDCDDGNEAVNPGALEICDDGIDNNCNGRADASDSVCRNNEADDEAQDGRPWWRNRAWKRYLHDRNDRRSYDHEHDVDDDDDDRYNREDDHDRRSSGRATSDRRFSWRRDHDDD